MNNDRTQGPGLVVFERLSQIVDDTVATYLRGSQITCRGLALRSGVASGIWADIPSWSTEEAPDITRTFAVGLKFEPQDHAKRVVLGMGEMEWTDLPDIQFGGKVLFETFKCCYMKLDTLVAALPQAVLNKTGALSVTRSKNLLEFELRIGTVVLLTKEPMQRFIDVFAPA